MLNKILQGDCLLKLKELETNSIDSIITDPPYELGFMGKSWDSTGIANNVEMWKECLRVLKPGGHLLAFSGTRTYHRMASAIEDAGFEVRDMIEWVYGSGFPKSLNIGKAVKAKELTGGSSPRNLRKSRMGNIYKPTGQEDYKKGRMFSSEIANDNIFEKIDNKWKGWGTSLKPAHEPICMARKPISEKTVAENCLKWGTGGINIDESRVATEDTWQTKESKRCGDVYALDKNPESGANKVFKVRTESEMHTQGRFPANLIHDNSEEVRECFPETKGGTAVRRNKGIVASKNVKFNADDPTNTEDVCFGDSGNASRFFKSIKTDELCTLCCLPYSLKHDTMSVCKNTNVNSAEKSLKTTQAMTEVIAPQSATMPDNKKFAQNVRSVANLCDLCVTYIAHELVGEKQVHQEEEVRGQVFITEQRKQILDNALASFVELRGKKDTTPTINDLSLLFGYVFNAIENSTTYSEQEKEVGKNHEWKSLLYQAKASKSERNKGCEGLEEKANAGSYEFRADGSLDGKPTAPKANFHPTVKPIALMEYLIKMVTKDNGTVLDPFAGSGTTGVACKNTNRKYILIEKQPEYIEIIKKRLEIKD